jgi:phenylalanyl-tRNA synthetase beta chain
LFELGACFTGSQEAVDEVPSLSLGLTGDVPPAPPVMLAADAPFYELKGALESVFHLFDTPAPAINAQNLPEAWEPGRAAAFELRGQVLAHFGQLSQAEAVRRKLRQPLHLAEINLALLLKYPLRSHTARELSRFQAVERDFSFVFPDAVVWSRIKDAIGALAIAELQRLAPIEVWRDQKKFGTVYASLIRVSFQAHDRTLGEADLTAWSAAIIDTLERLGGTQRKA